MLIGEIISFLDLYGIDKRDKNVKLCGAVFKDLSLVYNYICMVPVHMNAGAQGVQKRESNI